MPGFGDRLFPGTEIPGIDPALLGSLELEVPDQTLFHVVEVTGPVKHGNPFLPFLDLFFQDLETLSIAGRDNGRTIRSLQGTHHPLLFLELLGQDDL